MAQLAINKRPDVLQHLIDEKFENLSKSKGQWVYGGSKIYTFLGSDSIEYVYAIIKNNPQQKNVFLLDIGAGDFSWGQGICESLNRRKDLPSDVMVHIVSVTGENLGANKIIKTKKCILYNITQFKAENFEAALSGILPLINLEQDIKFDLVVSQWTFLHLIGPLGTFVEVYNRLRPVHGLMLMHGFPVFLRSNAEEQFAAHLDLDDSVLPMLANTNAPFLVNKSSSRSSKYIEFLLKRQNDQPLQLLLSYGDLVNKSYPGIGMQIATKVQYVVDDPGSWKTQFRPLIDNQDEVQGDLELYLWGYSNLPDWQIRLMAWSPLFINDKNAPITPKKDALFVAAIDEGNLEKTKEFIEEEPESVNRKDPYQDPLLCQNIKNPAILDYILSRKELDRNMECFNGGNPLHTAARMLNLLNLQKLLDFGFDVNKSDDRGQTPLHEMVAYNVNTIEKARRWRQEEDLKRFVQGIKLLIHAGADLTKEDEKGEKPMAKIKENIKIQQAKQIIPELVQYLE